MNEREKLERAIAAQKSLRAMLGDEVVDVTIDALKKQLEALKRKQPTNQQHKHVTVLIADVSGFTAMSETLDAKEVTEIMNALWQRLDAIISEHGGHIDKHIGDAVMALWGVETNREDNSEQAIKAALAMQAAIKEFTAQQQETALQMRIGFNTGPVLLEQVGTTSEFTAIGDTVDLASQLEHAAPAGGILISHNTYRHVRGVFDVLEQGPLTIKNKSDPIQTYAVQRLKPRAFRLGIRGVEGVETRMVGRQAELRYLQDVHYAIFEDGEMQVVTIFGEAGLGKSRLLHEYTQWAELQPENFRIFRARANQETQGLPYFLIRDFFAFRFEIAESDSAAVAREKLIAGITEFMGEGTEEKAHFIGYMLGYPFAKSYYLRGILDEPQQIHNIALHYLTQFFTSVTSHLSGGTEGKPTPYPSQEGMPTVILLEDIHWADESSLDVIQHLIRMCQDLPILIICSARPLLLERRPLWGDPSTLRLSSGQASVKTGGQKRHIRLELRSLSKRENRRLVDEILQYVDEIPPKLYSVIISHTKGNPLYVEEVIKVLLEDGIIVKETEELWRVVMSRLEDIQIPPTLLGVLQARLDALPEPEREALKRAAVVGRIFWDQVVAHLYKDTGSGSVPLKHVDKLLASLRGGELIFRREQSVFTGMQEYLFKHTLLRDVTYEIVLLQQRRQYHAQAATWLIEQSGERVEEYAGLIGEHYGKARQLEQAAFWYGRAGKHAQKTHAPEVAINYYQKALMLLSDQSDVGKTSGVLKILGMYVQRLQLYEGLGTILCTCGRYAKAIEVFSTMRAAAEAKADLPTQARVWNNLSWVYDYQGENQAALTSAEQAEVIARRAGPAAHSELAEALYSKGWELSRLGDHENALTVAEEALTLITAVANPTTYVRILNLLGQAHAMLGHYKQSIHYRELALTIAREQGNREREGMMLSNMGEIYRAMADHAKALRCYQEALFIFGEIGERQLESLVLSNIGGVRGELGEWAEAEIELWQVIEQIGDEGRWFLPQTYADLAFVCLRQNKIEAAITAAQQALSLAQISENAECLGFAWRILGQVLTKSKNGKLKDTQRQPAECFAESLKVYQESGMIAEHAKTLKVWADYELQQGDQAKGEAMWQEARAIFERLGLSSLLLDQTDKERETL